MAFNRCLTCDWTSILWSIDSCQNRAPTDQCHMTVSQARTCHSLRWRVFNVLCWSVIGFLLIVGLGPFFFRRNSVSCSERFNTWERQERRPFWPWLNLHITISFQLLSSNWDANTWVTHEMLPPIKAKYLKLIPHECNSICCLRVGVIPLIVGKCSHFITYSMTGLSENS